jgi:hypothetical protein
MSALDSVEAEGQKSPALDSLDVEGYKSIRLAKIDLGPINVLIGANGSGKSNLVGLFGLIADLADRRLQLHVARQGGANAILHFGQKKTPQLRISLSFAPLEYQAILVPSVGDTLVFGTETTGLRMPDAGPREMPPRAGSQGEPGNVGAKETHFPLRFAKTEYVHPGDEIVSILSKVIISNDEELATISFPRHRTIGTSEAEAQDR